VKSVNKRCTAQETCREALRSAAPQPTNSLPYETLASQEAEGPPGKEDPAGTMRVAACSTQDAPFGPGTSATNLWRYSAAQGLCAAPFERLVQQLGLRQWCATAALGVGSPAAGRSTHVLLVAAGERPRPRWRASVRIRLKAHRCATQ